MDARTRWRRFDAEHWIHVYGMVLTTVLTSWTAWIVLGGLFGGFVLAALIPGAFASLVGWMTSAWRREQPWSWWAWTVLATLSFIYALPALADPGLLALAPLVISGVLLLMLAHPDSRARIDRVPAGRS